MPRHTGLPCCSRWLDLREAYLEGRREEAVGAAQRLNAQGPVVCPLGLRVMENLYQEGQIDREEFERAWQDLL